MTDIVGTARHDARPIAVQASVGFVLTVASLAVNFGIRVMLARRLSTADFGLVLAGQALMSLALSIAGLGIADAVVWAVGRVWAGQLAPRRTVYSAMGVVMASTASVVAVLFAWIWLSDERFSTAARAVTMVLLLGMPFIAAGDVIGAAYRGINQLGLKIVAVDILRPGLVAIGLLVLPQLFAGRPIRVAALYAIAAVVICSGLWLWFALDRRWHGESGTGANDLLAYGFPLAGAAVIAGPLVNSGMPLLLSAWHPSDVVALYGIALSLAGFVYLPVAVLEQAALPSWSFLAAGRRFAEAEESFRHYTHACFAGAAAVGLVLIGNAPLILVRLFGSEYLSARFALTVATCATVFGALVGPNEAMLRALGRTSPIFKARIVSATLGVVAGLFLIPPFQLTGAAYAFAITNIAINSIYGIVLWQATAIHPFATRLVVSAGVALAGFIATIALGAHPSTPLVAVGFAVGLIAVNRDLRIAVRAVLDREPRDAGVAR